MLVDSSLKSNLDIADGVSYQTKSPMNDFHYQNDSMWPQVLNGGQAISRAQVSNYFSPRQDEYLLNTLTHVDLSKNKRKINRINAIYNY